MRDNLQDHPEYCSLLAAVKAAPADDLPRLVMADWLEEHDQPDWAEFIRAQCELDRHPHAARIRADLFTDAEGVRPEWQDGLASARRMRELWPAVSAVIAGTLGAGAVGRYSRDGDCIVVQGQSVVYEIRRGFPSVVRCRLADWFGRSGEGCIGPRLMRDHPIERVVLSNRSCGEDDNDWIADERVDVVVQNAVSNQLPWSFAVHLTGSTGGGHINGDFMTGNPPTRRFWHYPSPAAANAALSAAAIAWAAAQSDGA